MLDSLAHQDQHPRILAEKERRSSSVQTVATSIVDAPRYTPMYINVLEVRIRDFTIHVIDKRSFASICYKLIKGVLNSPNTFSVSLNLPPRSFPNTLARTLYVYVYVCVSLMY